MGKASADSVSQKSGSVEHPSGWPECSSTLRFTAIRHVAHCSQCVASHLVTVTADIVTSNTVGNFMDGMRIKLKIKDSNIVSNNNCPKVTQSALMSHVSSFTSTKSWSYFRVENPSAEAGNVCPFFIFSLTW